jgi:DNA polymerase-1
MEQVIQGCRTTGFVATLWGRRRYLPSIVSNNGTNRSEAERQAFNTVCQGTASDLTKKAMVRVWHQMKLHRLRTRILLQIHDELIFDVPLAELEQLKTIVLSSMQENLNGVLIPVKISVGQRWGELVEQSAASTSSSTSQPLTRTTIDTNHSQHSDGTGTATRTVTTSLRSPFFT